MLVHQSNKVIQDLQSGIQQDKLNQERRIERAYNERDAAHLEL
jgi:hypothetical protein